MTDTQFQKSWLAVARRIGWGGSHIFLCNEWLFCGAGEKYTIDDKMIRFSDGHRDRDAYHCWFDERDTPDAQEIRILFACLFSNMTVKEFEEVCGE